MKRRETVLAVLLCALAAAGCRPAQSDRAAEATRAFLAALDRGDGAAVCERLTEAGVSELLLLALEHRVAFEPADARAPDTCARIAERLPVGGVDILLRSPVSRVVLHGDRATVETEAGSYEAEERDGQWRVSRLNPVARALRGAGAPVPPVAVTVVSPDLTRPSLGPSVAGESTAAELELTGTVAPPAARVQARSLAGGSVERVAAGDGRFRIRLALRPGENSFALTATAPGREAAEIGVLIRRK
jgi:hypothetical protein